jgi:hypothetical protein
MDALPSELSAELYRFSDMDTFKALSSVSRGLRADCQRLIFVRRVVLVGPRWTHDYQTQSEYVREECRILSELFKSSGNGLIRELRHLILSCNNAYDESQEAEEEEPMEEMLSFLLELSGAVTRALAFGRLKCVSICIEMYREDPRVFAGLAAHISAWTFMLGKLPNIMRVEFQVPETSRMAVTPLIDLHDDDLQRKLVWLEATLPEDVTSLPVAGNRLQRLTLWHQSTVSLLWDVVKTLLKDECNSPALRYMRVQGSWHSPASVVLPPRNKISSFSNLRDLIIPLDFQPDGLYVFNCLETLPALRSVTFVVLAEKFYVDQLSWPPLPTVTRLGVRVLNKRDDDVANDIEMAFLSKFQRLRPRAVRRTDVKTSSCWKGFGR